MGCILSVGRITFSCCPASCISSSVGFRLFFRCRLDDGVTLRDVLDPSSPGVGGADGVTRVDAIVVRL